MIFNRKENAKPRNRASEPLYFIGPSHVYNYAYQHHSLDTIEIPKFPSPSITQSEQYSSDFDIRTFENYENCVKNWEIDINFFINEQINSNNKDNEREIKMKVFPVPTSCFYKRFTRYNSDNIPFSATNYLALQNYVLGYLKELNYLQEDQSQIRSALQWKYHFLGKKENQTDLFKYFIRDEKKTGPNLNFIPPQPSPYMFDTFDEFSDAMCRWTSALKTSIDDRNGTSIDLDELNCVSALEIGRRLDLQIIDKECLIDYSDFLDGNGKFLLFGSLELTTDEIEFRNNGKNREQSILPTKEKTEKTITEGKIETNEAITRKKNGQGKVSNNIEYYNSLIKMANVKEHGQTEAMKSPLSQNPDNDNDYNSVNRNNCTLNDSSNYNNSNKNNLNNEKVYNNNENETKSNNERFVNKMISYSTNPANQEMKVSQIGTIDKTKFTFFNSLEERHKSIVKYDLISHFFKDMRKSTYPFNPFSEKDLNKFINFTPMKMLNEMIEFGVSTTQPSEPENLRLYFNNNFSLILNSTLKPKEANFSERMFSWPNSLFINETALNFEKFAAIKNVSFDSFIPPNKFRNFIESIQNCDTLTAEKIAKVVFASLFECGKKLEYVYVLLKDYLLLQKFLIIMEKANVFSSDKSKAKMPNIDPLMYRMDLAKFQNHLFFKDIIESSLLFCFRALFNVSFYNNFLISDKISLILAKKINCAALAVKKNRQYFIDSYSNFSSFSASKNSISPYNSFNSAVESTESIYRKRQQNRKRKMRSCQSSSEFFQPFEIPSKMNDSNIYITENSPQTLLTTKKKRHHGMLKRLSSSPKSTICHSQQEIAVSLKSRNKSLLETSQIKEDPISNSYLNDIHRPFDNIDFLDESQQLENASSEGKDSSSKNTENEDISATSSSYLLNQSKYNFRDYIEEEEKQDEEKSKDSKEEEEEEEEYIENGDYDDYDDYDEYNDNDEYTKYDSGRFDLINNNLNSSFLVTDEDFLQNYNNGDDNISSDGSALIQNDNVKSNENDNEGSFLIDINTFEIILLIISLPYKPLHQELFFPSPVTFFNKLSSVFSSSNSITAKKKAHVFTEKLKCAFLHSDCFFDMINQFFSFDILSIRKETVPFIIRSINQICKEKIFFVRDLNNYSSILELVENFVSDFSNNFRSSFDYNGANKSIFLNILIIPKLCKLFKKNAKNSYNNNNNNNIDNSKEKQIVKKCSEQLLSKVSSLVPIISSKIENNINESNPNINSNNNKNYNNNNDNNDNKDKEKNLTREKFLSIIYHSLSVLISVFIRIYSSTSSAPVNTSYPNDNLNYFYFPTNTNTSNHLSSLPFAPHFWKSLNDLIKKEERSTWRFLRSLNRKGFTAVFPQIIEVTLAELFSGENEKMNDVFIAIIKQAPSSSLVFWEKIVSGKKNKMKKALKKTGKISRIRQKEVMKKLMLTEPKGHVRNLIQIFSRKR